MEFSLCHTLLFSDCNDLERMCWCINVSECDKVWERQRQRQTKREREIEKKREKQKQGCAKWEWINRPIHSVCWCVYVCSTSTQSKMHNNKYGVVHWVNCQKVTFSFSTTPSVSILSNLCAKDYNDDQDDYYDHE